jgi:hypothetical protein
VNFQSRPVQGEETPCKPHIGDSGESSHDLCRQQGMVTSVHEVVVGKTTGQKRGLELAEMGSRNDNHRRVIAAFHRSELTHKSVIWRTQRLYVLILSGFHWRYCCLNYCL